VLGAGLVERARAADIVELHWAEYARFASVLRRSRVRTPICVVEHDVNLAAAAQRVREHAVGYRRCLGLLTAPLVGAIERRGLIDADLVAVFKAADEQILRRAGVETPVQIIDPWLDVPSGVDPVRIPGTVLFTGALWRPANENGLVWFLDRVWPRVRASMAEAKLLLVGASPSERLVNAAQATSGVNVVGEVPDLLPYYRTASVFVAPLFVAGGLKFKVPQAMLCGLPVVTTTVGGEGVAEVAPRDVLWAVTNDPDEMAETLVTALRQEAAAAAVGRAAASWCREFYSFPRSMARLNALYLRLAKVGLSR
jgi:glycosyltransferase involved in cell wall biosynthesis